MSKAVRCAIVGDEPLVAQCADVARANGLDVVLIATSNHIVQEYAAEQGIASVGTGATLGAGLDEHPADVLLSIAYLRLVPEDVLARVGTAVNFHDGPLPGYAGLNVTTWALLNGEQQHAITWHVMTSGVDAGEIVATESFAVDPDETAFSLNARCYEAALATFPQIAAALAAGTLSTTPQPAGDRHVFLRHDRPAQIFDPARPAADSVRAVRSLDLGHRLRNTIGSVRWLVDDHVLVIDSARVAATPSGSPTGTIVAVDGHELTIATSDGDVVVTAVSTATGRPVDGATLADEFDIVAGRVLASPPAALAETIAATESALSKHESVLVDRLALQEPTALSASRGVGDPTTHAVETAGADHVDVVAAVALWLSRVSGAESVSFGLTDRRLRDSLASTAPLTREPVVLIDTDSPATFGELRAAVAAELDDVRRREPLLLDALGRDPRTRGRDLAAAVVVDLEHDGEPALGDVATMRVSVGDAVSITATAAADDAGIAERAAAQIAALLASGLADASAPLAAVDMVGPAEQAALDALNATKRDHDRAATVATLFHAQAARTPERAAASFGDRTLTYAELESAAASLGRRLAAVGVGRGDRVGIAVPRGLDMLAGVIATLDLGAAYVPLDPTYPIDRLRFMVEDSGLTALFATGATAQDLGQPGIEVVDPGADPAPDAVDDSPIVAHDPADLAYVIYTSGSTGKPKGVMLEHRAVTNFFAAMDDVIETDPSGVWLAVTSLSFDISVLELLWTVTRGFHVVIKADRGIPVQHGSAGTTGTVAVAMGTRPVSFSLFYFAAGEETASDGYRLLLDSARFADANGFEAVWTPERHFHAFGGAYPNPSVAGAALAAITENVAIRAGSVVLPLHSPIRVAEEWAVVDNISRGRVGISFAAGWQPNDFVLNPGAYATAKEDLPQRIDTVQRLWRGETVSLPGHDGNPVEVHTLPRPVQAELPVWLTSAGSPATFERAGTLGVNVLTHLLGQSIEQLTENLERYRSAWRDAGHAGEGRVTLMLHTYLDRDTDIALETAREPMKAYLSTAVGLLRDFASAFPTFAGQGKNADDLFKSLTPEEMDQLLEMAAHRYLSTSGLFGTPANVAAVVERVSAAGVDEVACLIDFGVDTDLALRSLDLLLEAKGIVDGARAAAEGPAAAQPAPVGGLRADPSSIDPTSINIENDTVAALVARHGVTHLQCTPSLAAMLVADPADRAALGNVRHLMLGGEALASALATELRELLPARFTNMYGPTETTIWSLTHEIDSDIGAAIPIGTPIGNTTVYVLDRDGARLGVGAFGELHIGGESVARGYHNRADLTAERFVDRPGMGRVYATGDVVRIHPAGYVEFAGRADNQVKIRGHRIELGEIETVIDRHPDVVQSVVVARTATSDGGSGDTRLVAYAVVHKGAGANGFSESVRKYVGEVLPDVMVPAAVVRLDAFPLTPNGKIDRKALPAPPTGLSAIDTGEPAAPPADDVERMVADIWVSELERPVGRDDNFFDIGGHSLLAVKVFRRLSDTIDEKIALTDIFRFPTVRTFAAHLGVLQGRESDDAAAPVVAPAGSDRGAMRRRALSRRGPAQED